MLGNQDKILSEIAEEDSISMISDKPRRFKPSDCVTPADPVTNSFMGSIRESHTNATNTRLKETANRMVHESNAIATASEKLQQQMFPYTQQQPSTTTATHGTPAPVSSKNPLVGGGSSQVTQKRPPSANKHSSNHHHQAAATDSDH